MTNFSNNAGNGSVRADIFTGPEVAGVAPGTRFQPPRYTAVSGLTAHAGGGAANATLLTSVVNVATTVATAADSVILPPAATGAMIAFANAGVASATVFPATGNTILGVNTGFAVAAAKSAMFFSGNGIDWRPLLSA